MRDWRSETGRATIIYYYLLFVAQAVEAGLVRARAVIGRPAREIARAPFRSVISASVREAHEPLMKRERARPLFENHEIIRGLVFVRGPDESENSVA